MSRFIYKVNRKTGKEYREYLNSGKIVEVEPHDGHIDEDKLINDLTKVMLYKMKKDDEFYTKIRNDAEVSFQQYNLSQALSDIVNVWTITPALKKANYKWWKIWLLPLWFRKNKEVRDAQEKMKNNNMHPKKVQEWLETSGIKWAWNKSPFPYIKEEKILEWACKGNKWK